MTTPTSHNGRLPEIDKFVADHEQRKAAVDFEAVRGFAPVGPFALLMHSPRLVNLARAMGDHLRYQSAIGTTLSELAILVTAREWSQSFEWFIHAPIALKEGIDPEIINSIRDGIRPPILSDDEAIIYDFSIELIHNKCVSDSTFARAERRFGAAGIVDLTAIHGYYTFLAMQLNVAKYEPPDTTQCFARFPL